MLAYGFPRGLWLTLARLFRCMPWVPAGTQDPVPDPETGKVKEANHGLPESAGVSVCLEAGDLSEILDLHHHVAILEWNVGRGGKFERRSAGSDFFDGKAD